MYLPHLPPNLPLNVGLNEPAPLSVWGSKRNIGHFLLVSFFKYPKHGSNVQKSNRIDVNCCLVGAFFTDLTLTMVNHH